MRKKDKFLFIGGPMDGERIMANGFWKCRIHADGVLNIYERSEIRSGERTFEVYRFDGLSDEKMIEMLLDGYGNRWDKVVAKRGSFILLDNMIGEER